MLKKNVLYIDSGLNFRSRYIIQIYDIIFRGWYKIFHTISLGGVLTRPLSFISKIESDEEPPYLFRRLERVGDMLMSPARLLCGRTYSVYTDKGVYRLKSPENWSWQKRVGQAAAIILLPLSLLSTITGALLKKIALVCALELTDKYALPFPLINARSEDNFTGHLPPNPLTPNCVNSQQSSLWGKLYNVEPIKCPKHISDSEALNVMDQVISDLTKNTSCSPITKLTEKRDSYRHYEFTVRIPRLGTFIDDLDLWYDVKRRVIDIRSASRLGFRDALNLNFSIPGENKRRVEILREAFKSYTTSAH